jgi:hypothetical protein
MPRARREIPIQVLDLATTLCHELLHCLGIRFSGLTAELPYHFDLVLGKLCLAALLHEAFNLFEVGHPILATASFIIWLIIFQTLPDTSHLNRDSRIAMRMHSILSSKHLPPAHRPHAASSSSQLSARHARPPSP